MPCCAYAKALQQVLLMPKNNLEHSSCFIEDCSRQKHALSSCILNFVTDKLKSTILAKANGRHDRRCNRNPGKPAINRSWSLLFSKPTNIRSVRGRGGEDRGQRHSLGTPERFEDHREVRYYIRTRMEF